MTILSLETIPMDLLIYISTNYFEYSILYKLGLINRYFNGFITNNISLWKYFYNQKYQNTRNLQNIDIYRNALVKKIYKEYIVEYNLFNRVKLYSNLITQTIINTSLISLIENNQIRLDNIRKYKCFSLLQNKPNPVIEIELIRYQNIDIIYHILLSITNKIINKHQFIIDKREILLSYLEKNHLYNHYFSNTHITYYLYNLFIKWWNRYSINGKLSFTELLQFKNDFSIIDYNTDYQNYNYKIIVDTIQIFYHYSNNDGIITQTQFINYLLDYYHLPQKMGSKYLIKYIRRLLSLYKLLIPYFNDGIIFTRILI